MNAVKVLIVDDESSPKNVLSTLIQLSFPELVILPFASSVLEAVDLIHQEGPDIVFVDVEMPFHKGYELVNFFDQINFQIIFATAYDHFAIKAFEVNAVDYLLKPIERNRLTESIDKALKRIEIQKIESNYKALIHEIEEENSAFIVLTELSNKQQFKLNEILAFQADGSYSKVHLKDRSFTITKNLAVMEKELTDSVFFRSHKSWLINLNCIESYNNSKQEIMLESGLACKLSRFKKAEFQDYFEG